MKRIREDDHVSASRMPQGERKIYQVGKGTSIYLDFTIFKQPWDMKGEDERQYSGRNHVSNVSLMFQRLGSSLGLTRYTVMFWVIVSVTCTG